jgi:hypothetical protein
MVPALTSELLALRTGATGKLIEGFVPGPK